MRLLPALFLFAISFGFCSAQDKGQIVITGRVADMENIPLINATIFDTATKKGAITNKQGIFKLAVPKKSTVISISYVGYYTLEREITTAEINQSKNDTLLLSIQLKPKTTVLSEVEVSAANIQRAYDKPGVLIVDYDFHPDGLLLLLAVNNQYKLRLVDEHGNTLHDVAIRKHPERLFRDCFDNLHLVYSDSVYQINGDKADLSLMGGFSKKQFNDLLLPCVAASEAALFFRDYGLHNQSVIYYFIENSSNKKKLLQEITDKESLVAVDDFYQETMAEAGMAPNVMGNNSVAQQNSARKVEKKLWFYQIILSRPAYHPLLEARDSLFLFNHVTDTAWVYDKSGELQRAFPIHHHYQAGWKNEIITDYSKKEMYAKCVRSGLVYLLQIDACNVQNLKEYKLNGHIFPDNIKIRDGYAYYLYKDNKNLSVQNVYRQKLK